jgi:hypothetical protein
MSVDFKSLNATQETALRKIMSICEYLAFARSVGVEDSVLAERAKELGFLFSEWAKAEGK